MTSDTLRLVGAFCTGSAAVAVAGYILHRKLTAELLEELERTRSELNEAMAEKREIEELWKTKTDLSGSPLKPTDDPDALADYLAKPYFGEDTDDRVVPSLGKTVASAYPEPFTVCSAIEEETYPDEGDDDPAEEEEPYPVVEHVDENPDPHRIEYQSYLCERIEWPKLELEYYAGDDTLVDDNDEVVDDAWVERTLGIEEPLSEYWERYGVEPEMWWRVPKMGLDVDILFNDSCYFGEGKDKG